MKTMSNTCTIEHHNEVICKAAREALIGTGLELMPFSYAPARYVMPSETTDALEIRIGLVTGSEWPTVRVVTRQQISNEAIYADGGSGLLAEVNRACMDARKEIYAQLTALAAKVDPRRNCGRESSK